VLELDKIEINDPCLFEELFTKGFIQRGEVLTLADDTANFLLLTCGSQSALVAAKGVFLNLVREGKCGVITPRDKEQVCATYGFKNYELVVLLGNAGSGKTTLAIAWAWQRIFKANKKLILCKPTVQVGSSKAIGTVPGTVEEKLAPYIASYLSTMKDISGKANFADKIAELKEKDMLEFLPIELVRGMNLCNATLIVDEVQNLSVHELNSVISRAGEGTQVILLGDLSQIDTKMRMEETGIYRLCNSETFLDSEISIGIKLVQNYRSGVSKLSIEWMQELSGSY
jgi:predicted ribonuclease YlaK